MKFEYISSIGENIIISNKSLYLLKNYSGFDMPDTDRKTTKGYGQDGVTFNAVTLKPREMKITGYINGSSRTETENEIDRLMLSFRQKETGILRCTTDCKSMDIECITTQLEVPYQKNWRFQEFTLNLIGPKVFFTDTSDNFVELTSWEGGMKFPFRLPVKLAHRGEPTVKIFNDGHEDTPVLIIFRGPAERPKIQNLTTGSYVAVNQQLAEDEALFISTEYENEYIEIEKNGIRANAYNRIDPHGALDMTLKVGDNVLKYSSNSPAQTNAVEIRYRRRYLSI